MTVNWIQLLRLLVPAAVTVAESIHPLSGSGKLKLATATTLIQTGLGMAAAAGAIPPAAAGEIVTIVHEVNQHVAAANAKGGVGTIEEVAK